jgi:hypothetical protein
MIKIPINPKIAPIISLVVRRSLKIKNPIINP